MLFYQECNTTDNQCYEVIVAATLTKSGECVCGLCCHSYQSICEMNYVLCLACQHDLSFMNSAEITVLSCIFELNLKVMHALVLD